MIGLTSVSALAIAIGSNESFLFSSPMLMATTGTSVPFCLHSTTLTQVCAHCGRFQFVPFRGKISSAPQGLKEVRFANTFASPLPSVHLRPVLPGLPRLKGGKVRQQLQCQLFEGYPSLSFNGGILQGDGFDPFLTDFLTYLEMAWNGLQKQHLLKESSPRS